MLIKFIYRHKTRFFSSSFSLLLKLVCHLILHNEIRFFDGQKLHLQSHLYIRPMMFVVRLKTVNCVLFTILLTFTLFGYFYNFNNVKDKDLETPNFFAYKTEKLCRDWNNYEFLKQEKERIGIGEHGIPVKLTNETEIQINKELYEKTGFYVVVSDKISVNRSIPDMRPKECRKIKYLNKLPNVSIIVIFHNEVLSVLKRTIHSIINRTPPELLHEIILVNDASKNEELYEPLEKYIKLNFPTKVKILHLKTRHGLIRTRIQGARKAKGEIIIFFDSHMEMNTNWLPPLIEPIAKNRRISTVPIIDSFDPETFQILDGIDKYGDRAMFDWKLVYKTFPRYLPENVIKHLPYQIPIMLGCAFAIDRKFFLEELGGYDEGYEIWNAENYELSFKLWLCADGVIAVPCSHVTHTFRMINPSRKMDYDYEGKNFKRLAEVWLDEYKEVIYNQDRKRYDKINPGDLSIPLATKSKLTCKPFSYFLDRIAPEIIQNFPMNPEKQSFAHGRIRFYHDDNICIDTFGTFMNYGSVGVYYCANDTSPDLKKQLFRLTYTKNIMEVVNNFCLDSYKFSMQECNFVPYGNQYWRYDHRKHWIMNGRDDSNQCITIIHEKQALELMTCDENNQNQRFKFDYENLEAIENFDKIFGYPKPENFLKITRRDKLLPIEYEFCDE